MTEKQRRGDIGNEDDDDDTVDLKYVSRNVREKKFQIKNHRPEDLLDERDTYEELCRQNGSQVRMLSFLFENRLFEFIIQ